MSVLIRASATSYFCHLFALIELAFGCLGTLDTFEARPSALAGDIDTAAVILLIAILDAPEVAWPTNRLDPIALALCGPAGETGSSRDVPMISLTRRGGVLCDGRVVGVVVLQMCMLRSVVMMGRKRPNRVDLCRMTRLE